MNIHQISVRYINEQDRIFLRINLSDDKELRLWLTRRLTLAVVPVLQAHNAQQIDKSSPVDPTAPLEIQRQQLLDNFGHEAAAYEGDFTTPYHEPTSPSAADDMLVTDITLNSLSTGDLQLDVFEKLSDASRNVQVMMQPKLAHGLMQLLGLAIQQSGWLNMPTLTRKNENDPDLDVFARANRPVYLN